jgi:hypothetical protein
MARKICLNNAAVGAKYSSLFKDINIEEYKLICQVLDKSDQDYGEFVNQMNIDLSNLVENQQAQAANNSNLLLEQQARNDLAIQQYRDKYL